MEKEVEKKRSINGDDTNVLAKEFKPFAVNGKQIRSSVWINLRVRVPSSTKLPNEMMSNLYVFSSRMLNQILRDVDGTGIVTVDGKMLLTNTVIMEEFLHP